MSATERVWRLRKNHTWLDARLRERDDAEEVEVQFYYDGTLISARCWPTRQLALDHAERQRREFELAGWNPHW